MTIRDYRLSGKTITIDIPDNLGQLLIRRDELQFEWTALKKRLTTIPDRQRIRLNSEIAAVKRELKIVNEKIAQLDPQVLHPVQRSQVDALERKISKRQKKLEAKGLESFPRFGTDREKFEWAISQLNLAIGLLNGENRTDLSKQSLIEALGDGFSQMISSQKLDEIEADQAKQHLRKSP